MSEKYSVYVETSVVGYATSWPRRDPLVSARQELTKEWFAAATESFNLYVSQIVLDELAAGDSEAAEERLSYVSSLPILGVSEEADELAINLVRANALPIKASVDALHIAVAAVNGVQFLVTWNCKHIANAIMRTSIENQCREAGFEPPIICTPEELGHEP